MYLHARFYAPAIGRFLSPDTIVPAAGDPQSLNRYAYTFNNPLKYNDPSGRCPWCFIGALVGAVIGYGAQVVNNLNNGMDLGQALTTDIDPMPIVTGAVIGFTAVAAAPVAVAAGGEVATGVGLVTGSTTLFAVGTQLQQAATGLANFVQGISSANQTRFVTQPANSEYSNVLERSGRQAAVDYTVKRYGINFPATTVEGPTYDLNLTPFGRTTSLGNGMTRVTIGPSAFSSEAQLASTLGHECVHCIQYAQEASGSLAYDLAAWEMQAWRWEIENAGITGLSAAERANAIGMWKFWTNLWRNHHGIE